MVSSLLEKRDLYHCIARKERKWILGNDIVKELYEYKNLGVVKNYIGSFSLMLKRISTKRVKKQECYFQRTLIVVKLTP